MKAFEVGDRIRIVGASRFMAYLIGEVGTVTHSFERWPGCSEPHVACSVKLDNHRFEFIALRHQLSMEAAA
jgi:hypothetical protein